MCRKQIAYEKYLSGEFFGAHRTLVALTSVGGEIAALSGDLETAAELMPAAPQMPAGTTLRPATRQRIEMVSQYLYEGDAATQAALRSLLEADGGEPASVK